MSQLSFDALFNASDSLPAVAERQPAVKTVKAVKTVSRMVTYDVA